MKTIIQALRDEIYYPVSDGLLENRLLSRELPPDGEFSRSVMLSSAWIGALADTLISLVQAVNISEGDKSIGGFNDTQRKALINRANSLYSSIGEEEVSLIPKPTVYIGSDYIKPPKKEVVNNGGSTFFRVKKS